MGATKDFSRFVNIVDAVDVSDEIVLRSAQNGDLEALEILMNRYKNFVKAKARSYFLVGADREDIVQEGMIGLFKAVRDYCDEKPSSFKVFAELCITRQMITAIKTATRQKHIPLNSYISLNKPVCEHDSDRTLMEMVSGQRITNPEELMISQEELVTIEDIIGEVLSKLEMKVLMLYINGRSYQEIAKDLGRSEKSIDNALQRVKRKLERYLETKRKQDGY
ncbi:RNA polymerase, sigma 30 subunit, SigH [Tindallia magadiensis]|uniref:RNA polymerase, sigma 30 subunit, SigH n=1 Tax=Tindallia magadiensis TaxID=69895 RepID=A0A1I3HPU4_9FIRM|nr:RNA polymerase sporulation sigma factor SigH [Tindallia magadiensis]SFI37609.1 RNA polymerase, sigma 30 subunit, SigH [Tindallia magadiensis]